MKHALLTFAIALAAAVPAGAHRLDEYLQGALVSVEKNRVDVEMTLTPGVAIFPFLIGEIDANGDGIISETEKQAYAVSVLRDLSLAIDGHSLAPHVISSQFPAIEEMKEGRGEILLRFDAELPSGGPRLRLTFDNRHQSRFAAYQVNALVSRDPAIQIGRQSRNYTQSHYELEFTQASAQRSSIGFDSIAAVPEALGVLALLLMARFGLAGLRQPD
jgi:hypothetical protein